jgi:hypothetical protein
MNRKRKTYLGSPNLRMGQIPRKVPKGKFIWHNHVQHCVGMGHGVNGFRYRTGLLPIDYHIFQRCHCGVIDFPHYQIRGRDLKCVSVEQIYRNSGFTAKQARQIVKGGIEALNEC